MSVHVNSWNDNKLIIQGEITFTIEEWCLLSLFEKSGFSSVT